MQKIILSSVDRSNQNRVQRHTRMGRATLAGALAVAGIATSSAYGDWVGTTNSDWNTASNWTGSAFPAGDAIINNTAGPGVFPVISANSAFTPVDVRIGTTGGIGRVDHVAGTAGTGNGNWMFLGYVGSTATYNLADTASTGGTLTGFGVGSGSLNVGGTTQNGNLLAGLDNGTTSTVNVNTTGTLAAGGIFLGAAGASSGNMNVDAGKVNVSGEFQIGANFFSQGAGTSTLKMSGGSVTADIVSLARGNNNTAAMNATATLTGGTLSSGRYFTLGFAGAVADTSTVNNSGGTINVNTTAGATGVLEMGVFDVTTNVFNANSGSVTLQNNASIVFGSGGNHSGTSTFNQNGGTVILYSDAGATAGGTGSVNLGTGGDTGTYAYNLNGGALTVPLIQKTGANASGTFNFNGGTVKPTTATASFLQGLTRANVRNGGAIIDTNVNVNIAQAILHSNIGGDNATDGGLAKNGTGTLTLSGINAYTGNTAINAGTLDLADNAGLLFVIGASGVNNKMTGTGTDLLEGDFTFDLSGASTTVGSSWNIVDVANLNETFSSTFTVANPGFTESANVWTGSANGAQYSFSESTGTLSVVAVPEPASAFVLLGTLTVALRRRRA